MAQMSGFLSYFTLDIANYLWEQFMHVSLVRASRETDKEEDMGLTATWVGMNESRSEPDLKSASNSLN